MGKHNRTFTSVAHFLRIVEETRRATSVDVEMTAEELSIPFPPNAQVVEDVIQEPSCRNLKPVSDRNELRKYDATSLVKRYESEDDVPGGLQKYFAQRYRYFSLYDDGCLLDEEGWYSVTPEKIADQIADRCRCDTILDAFCGVGGNAIAFAKTCHRVVALDISPVRLALARHNATVYGVADRIEFILADYLDFARSYVSRSPNSGCIDVVFLSPPWGGPSYLDSSPQKEDSEDEFLLSSNYTLNDIRPAPGDELFRLSRQISRNVAYFLPRNIDLDEVSQLLKPHSNGLGLIETQREPEEVIEVEEEYMGGKLKALTCYFGGLVSGQETMF